MPKFLVIILLAIAPLAASAQCKFKVDEKDPITNHVVKRHSFFLSGSFEITVARKGDTFEFIVDLELDGEQNFRISPGTKTIIKLSNGEILEILNNNTASPTTHVGRRVVSRYKLIHSVSLDFYKSLGSSSLEHIRKELEGQVIDVPVKSKVGVSISQYADCIIQ
jgi:hypothetical protein